MRRFDTVELDASFYRWPRTATFASWRRRLPPGFRLSVKAPRGLTHAKRLYAPEAWVQRMTAAWHELGDRRAVLLVQLHPAHGRDDDRLEYFLQQLPDRMRVAVEFRHAGWHVDEVFAYVRLHGPDREHLYAGSYPGSDLRWWDERIGEWRAQGRDVYAYFNNDGHGHAVRDAGTLRDLLGG